MFQKKQHEILFTVVTSGLMIYCMGVYNLALHSGGLRYGTFAAAARSFLPEWCIGFLAAVFLASPLAGRLAFRVARRGDRMIFIVLCVQSFTVCAMVPVMSLVGSIESSGMGKDLPVVWLQTVALNFPAAYLLQIFAVGPLARGIFRRACGAFREEKATA